MLRKFTAALLVGALFSAVAAHADAPFELRSTGGKAGMVSYNVNGTAYAAYATPTDMVGICGSATRTVFVNQMWMSIGSTSGALQTVYFVKRSTADTGGTSTNPAAVQYDSGDPAATAKISLYSAIPTTGTLVGNLRITQITSGVLTAPYGLVSLYSNGQPYASADLIRFTKPTVLRGTNECLYINYNGAALTSGFAALWGIDWTEL